MPTDEVSYYAIPLDVSSGRLKNPASLGYSAPAFNNIRAIAPDTLTLVVAPPYYGDKLNLAFWTLLGVPFGTSNPSSTPLTLHEDYLYVYNYSRATFTVYSNSRERLLYVTNIKSIADMNIDFTIMNSHQFLVIVDPSNDEEGFIIPVRLKESGMIGFSEDLDALNNIKTVMFENSYILWHRIMHVFEIYDKYLLPPINTGDVVPKLLGINHNDVADRVRPYSLFDTDNPIWHSPLYIKSIEYLIYYSLFLSPIGSGYDTGKLYSLVNVNRIGFDKNYPMEYFYRDMRVAIEAVKIFEVMQGSVCDFDYLLPKLSKDMFPRLQPIQKDDEVNNGRPVYEPWLIYALDWSKILEDGTITYPPGTTVDRKDQYEVPTFDLSPWWA